MSGNSVFSISVMIISANTGPSGDPIATPSVCTKIFLLYVKWTFLVHSVSIAFISDLVIGASSTLWSEILLNNMSIVQFNGTLVKSDFTSNDTISYPAGMGSFFIFRVKLFVLLMLCSDSLNRDSTFDTCFPNWYVAVLMFDTMILIGRSSILPLAGNLCNFAVP